MSERSQKFIDYIIKKISSSTACVAALKRADNPNTQYQSWEILAGFGVNLENNNEILPFAVIAADIAWTKPDVNGTIKIGEAIAKCYNDGNQSEQAKLKLRRILACNNTAELCRLLRPLFSLIAAKGTIRLDYVTLLDQLLRFHRDESRECTKIRWAQEFYKNYKKEEDDING